MIPVLVWILVIWNTIVFAIYGIDKYKAVKNKWRISEKVLILCAFLMGSAGAILGMEIFRHKTKKLTFKIAIPLAFLANCGVIIMFGKV